jgi:stage III sporulation protein AF
MGALKGWLMGLIALSVVCAAAEGLMPPGSVKRVGKLVCGLALLWMLLRPLSVWKGVSLSGAMEDWASRLEEQTEQLEHQTGLSRRSVIEQHFAAYIADKGRLLGVPCRVEVVCAPGEEGLWLPESVRLWGDFEAVAQSRMTQLLSEELGIPVEEQTYYLTKEAQP